MTTNTPARPQQDTTAARQRRPLPAAPHEPSPAETGPLTPRPRGRHRKPRPRKALLAAGGLALAAGVLSLVRLTSGTGPDGGVGAVEAEPRPDPVVSGTDETPGTAAARPDTPEAGPSSPTALGGLTPSPVTRGAGQAPSAPAGHSGRTTDTPTAPEPGTSPRPAPANPPADPPAQPPRDDAPRPAPTAPAPPSRTAPTPTPGPGEPDEPRKPQKPQDPGLCVPVIGLCADPPVDRR
ncbi:hypothetical protein ABTZ58_17830 [Streptomyces sp. NPDC094143]|uniref:hypothetical protein n=1 Tax=Streptomyces sp. NPDC094143 TaxID=3155310 RepID=UPI00332BC9A6